MGISQLLNQSGSLENTTGVTDRGGRPIFGSPTAIAIRFEESSRTIVGKDREREPIDGVVFVMPSVAVSKGARITYQEQKYRVMKVAPIVLGNGKIHHKELLVQSWSYAS